MLYILAAGAKAMFEEIISDKNLEAAYLEFIGKLAKDSKEFRYHGLDDFRLLDYELDSKELLAVIKAELINQQAIDPALLITIPKKNNPAKSREIFIYTIKERIKAQAIYRVLLPVFENYFSDRLFSYRPGKPPYLASYLFCKRYRRCFASDNILILDLSNYSSLIDQTILVKQLTALLPDPKVLDLLKLYIFNKVYDNSLIKTLNKGIVQGVPLIAMFANLYLSDLDFKYQKKVSFYIRVGDDLALIDPDLDKLKIIVLELSQELRARGLKINQEKMFVGQAKENFSFLGYNFSNGIIGLEPGFIRKLELGWKELLVYKNNSDYKKSLILKGIMNNINQNFNNQFKRIVKEKSQVNNSAQIKALSEKFFKILTEFFFQRYTARNRRLLSGVIKPFKIFSLYSYYKNFHYERGQNKP